ncbi:DUF6924 domain-containing protein [Streptomyces sp. NPDC059118]|uniref:DUF6924 domain-containing protein n=1 Tax=unclassified Streptomyces TaxID=2593676 RepID=UPI0036C6B87D
MSPCTCCGTSAMTTTAPTPGCATWPPKPSRHCLHRQTPDCTTKHLIVTATNPADRVSMQAEHHPLLAVTALTQEDCVDDEEYDQLTEFGREFRTIPAGVHEVYANLSIGNLGFEEFTAWAHDDPEGIYRPFRMEQ